MPVRRPLPPSTPTKSSTVSCSLWSRPPASGVHSGPGGAGNRARSVSERPGPVATVTRRERALTAVTRWLGLPSSCRRRPVKTSVVSTTPPGAYRVRTSASITRTGWPSKYAPVMAPPVNVTTLPATDWTTRRSLRWPPSNSRMAPG